ncbi:hypothetical protein [Massilia sp. CF038]|uniref:hypothetical protein n=1 Tax=Massilia sp. CF038 TaxID=1881045 RepID=UPI000911F8C3|nr:hypothetical protein [Massilia sp. CF038]SHG55638.1 hypothetical protein SAMN05428948_1012 [Massilia sp. CF038]
MNRSAIAAGMLAALTAAGCATPVYQSQAGMPAAQLKTSPVINSQLCLASGTAQLAASADGFAAIPAGRPLHIVFERRERQVRCAIGLRFTPEAGRRYVFVIDTADESCLNQIVLEDPSTRIGIRELQALTRAADECGH